MERVQERINAYVKTAIERTSIPLAPDLAIPPLEREACLLSCEMHGEHLYIACFGTPTTIRSRDYHPADRHDHPVEHYVGYTTQLPPRKRIFEHGAATARSLVVIVPGTREEEAALKCDARCPRCTKPLWYFRVPIDDSYRRQRLRVTTSAPSLNALTVGARLSRATRDHQEPPGRAVDLPLESHRGPAPR
jgi:hypothetical protein